MKKIFSIFNDYRNLIFALSERKDGSMLSNLENQKKFLEKIGVNFKLVVRAGLIHGKRVKVVGKKDCGKIIQNVDGLITKEKEVFLSITAADCLPIFIFDPKKEILGLVHAGWRGLKKGILFSTIEEFKKLKSNLKNVLVGIGPGICQKHYEVRENVSKFFTNYPGTLAFLRNKIFLDLKKVAEIQLLKLGIQKKNIEKSPECTFCLPKKYFSFRREKLKGPKVMLAVFGQK